MNELPLRDDSSGTKDNQSKKSGAPINDARSKRLLDEASEKDLARTKNEPHLADEQKSAKWQPPAEHASGQPIIADKIQRDLAPSRALADETKNLPTQKTANDLDSRKQSIVETAVPRAAAEARTASPSPLTAAETRTAAEPRAALDSRVVAEPRSEASATANTSNRRELRVPSEESKAGVKEQQSSGNPSDNTPLAAKALAKETVWKKETDNNQPKPFKQPEDVAHTTTTVGSNISDTKAVSDKTLTPSQKRDLQPQAPYPGERGVIKFLEFLPEDVRHHMRWQNSLTDKGFSSGTTQPFGTVHSPEALVTPSNSNSATPRSNSTSNTSQQAINSSNHSSDTHTASRVSAAEYKSTPRTQSPPVRSHSEPASHTSKHVKDFKSSKFIGEKRYITGAEIALAAIVSAAGIAKNRQNWTNEIKGEATNNPQPKGVVRPETCRADSHRFNQNHADTNHAELVRTDLKRTDPDQCKINKLSDARTDSKIQSSKAGVSASHLSPSQPLNVDTPCVPKLISNIKVEKKHVENLPILKTLDSARAKLTRQFSPKKMVVASSSANIIENISIIPERGEQTITYAKDIERSRPKMLISMRDTLVSIAETIYHDSNLGWLIADLNLAWIKESWIDGKRIIECKNRQPITLPIWEDVISFYKYRPSNSRPENLVTVVVDTAVDKELLQSQLGTIFDGSPSKKPTRKRIQKDFKR